MHIQIDPAVRDFLESRDVSSPSVGLIVGVYPENPTTTPVKVLHLAQTNPAEPSDTPPTIATLATSLLTHHTRSLLRMLPGGMNILGIYSTSSEISSTPPKALLNSLTKNLSTKFSAYQPFIDPEVYLQFDGKKFDVITLDKDGNKTLKLDVVFKECVLSKVQVDFWLSGVGVQQYDGRGDKGAFFEVKEGVERVVEVWKDCLQDSDTIMTLFDGNLASTSTRYVESAPVSILVAKLPTYFLEKGKGRDNRDFINHLHLRGKMHLIAYVNEGESTKRAEMATHVDLLRSLSARLQLHCESLIEEDSNIEASQGLEKVVHELPRRVFVKLSKEEIYVCDYLFPGEGPRDCLESFGQVLGEKYGVLEEEEVVDGWEGVGDMESIGSRNEHGSSMEQLADSISSMQKKSNENSGLVWFGVVLAVLIGLIAIFVMGWK